jgi:hypothetical protein
LCFAREVESSFGTTACKTFKKKVTLTFKGIERKYLISKKTLKGKFKQSYN